jgi:hypothetical protein
MVFNLVNRIIKEGGSAAGKVQDEKKTEGEKQ